MNISFSDKIVSSDALFIFLPEKKWDKKSFGKVLPSSLEKEVAARISKKDFKGEKGEMVQIFVPVKGVSKVFLAGVGKCKEMGDMRKAAGLAIRKAKKLKAKNVSFMVCNEGDVKRIISGGILGDYEFKLGDTKDQFSPKKLHIVSPQKVSSTDIKSEKSLAEGVNFARDLINLPSNFMTPKILAQKAKQLGKGVGNKVKVKTYGEKELKKLGMGNIFGVGQGSHEESQLIVLEYFGGKKKEAPLAVVGKGVCFDSGGYNLKPTNHIEEMKSDMSGAASVLGVFQWIAATKPKKNIIGVVGAVENMVSGNAYKPGDIITAMNGKTIEITNTDAEGRLVLGDCLYYTAKKYKPAAMIDLATLTGAAIAALGYEITAIMGNDSKLLQKFTKASEASDEMVWELPITDLFREKTKGENSDLINWTAGVNAGSSMGGAFLEGFVEKTPWIHIDIAGTAFHGKAGTEIYPKGATGVMVRTLKEFIEQ